MFGVDYVRHGIIQMWIYGGVSCAVWLIVYFFMRKVRTKSCVSSTIKFLSVMFGPVTLVGLLVLIVIYLFAPILFA
jgi:hypothetical protein